MRTIHHSKLALITGAVLVAGLVGSSQLVAAEAPVVGISGATNLTAASATLKGSVNPKGLPTAAWFEWGAGDGFASTTARTNLASGSIALNVGNQITGLTSGVIYHYRVAASNSLGVIRSVPVRFGLPKLTVLGANPLANPLNTNFVDPGVIVTSTPVAIVAGYHQILTLKADGQPVGWGVNDNGQSTVPSDVTNAVAVASGDLHALALRANGSVTGWGYNIDGEINIPAGATNNVIAIASGGYHGLALKSGGSVVAWGGDWDGQSTVPSDATNIIALAAGATHSLALKADGSLVGWGNPAAWQGRTNIIEVVEGEVVTNTPTTGYIPDGLTNITAIAAGGNHCLALRADGTVYVWGDESGAALTPAGATNIVTIAAGYGHNVALKADGSVLAWGANGDGQSDVPPEATNSIAFAAGVNFSVAFKADGTMVYWGIPDPILTDMPDGLNTPTNRITISGTVLTNVAGSYTLTYRATNILGFAASGTRSVLIGDQTPSIHTLTLLENGACQIGFDFLANKVFTVLATTNITVPTANWPVVGQAVEGPPGHYQFTEPGAANLGQRYYRVRMTVP